METKSYKFFSEVGIEPTFFPTAEIPKEYASEPMWWADRFYHEIIGVARNFLDRYSSRKGSTELGKDLYEWLINNENDDNVLEMPTVRQFKTLEELIDLYKKLLKIIDQIGFAPSAAIDMESEGGCHINVDLSELLRLERERQELFCRNLINFTNSYPSFVWAHTGYNDDTSAQILFIENDFMDDTEKGQCLNFRTSSGKSRSVFGTDTPYIECRFFSMPVSVEEMEYILILCDKFIRYCYDQTMKGNLIPQNNTPETLKEYDFLKAHTELKEALSIIGVDWEEATKHDKPTNLRKRFDLNDKNLLV